jgi:hypothetical protein
MYKLFDLHLRFFSYIKTTCIYNFFIKKKKHDPLRNTGQITNKKL